MLTVGVYGLIGTGGRSMKEVELLPCPMCGSKAQQIKIGYDDPVLKKCGYYIMCSAKNCCVCTPFCFTYKACVTRWNRRVKNVK